MNESSWYHDGTEKNQTMRRLVEKGDLNAIRSQRIALVRDGLEQGRDAAEISRNLSRFNQDLIGAIFVIHAREHPWLGECTWLEFGSGGRQEQVLSSDQDNGLIYPVPPDSHDLDEVTQDMVMTLDGAGMRLCPGGVMVTSPTWRGTGGEWSARLQAWLANPAERGPWQYGLILDFRPLVGPEDQAIALRQELWEYIRTRPLVLRLLADELAGYRIPLTMWGNFVLIKKGPFQGGLDIKKSGLVRLGTAARILALKHGLTRHHTLDRVHDLVDQGHIGTKLGQRLARFWSWSQGQRLAIGLEELSAGRQPHNVVYPYRFKREEILLLKDGLHAVEKFSRLVLDGAGF
jgi:CBS domain-containing protein